MPKRRNQNRIHRIRTGRPKTGYTMVPNEVYRDLVGGCGGNSDVLAVFGFLLSHQDGWATSANEMSRRFCWSLNGNRARQALRLLAENRLVVTRKQVRPDDVALNSVTYVFNDDGSPLSEEEFRKWSVPEIVKPPRD